MTPSETFLASINFSKAPEFSSPTSPFDAAPTVVERTSDADSVLDERSPGAVLQTRSSPRSVSPSRDENVPNESSTFLRSIRISSI